MRHARPSVGAPPPCADAAGVRGVRQRGKRFRVVVADARPGGEGRGTLRALLRAGIACTYVLLNAVPLVLQARRPALPCRVVARTRGRPAARRPAPG